MEEIIEKLTNNSVSNGSNNSSQFAHYYKATSNIDNQQKRRETLLNAQKRKRACVIDEVRWLSNEKDLNECMEWSCNVSSPKKKKKIYCKEYQNKLMFSEWLIDIPENFETNWVCVFCPKGHRALLVTHKGVTEVYTKYGSLQAKFKSHLPSSEERGDTMLDCIWIPESKQYFILEALYWDGMDLRNFDMELRTFWLQSKYEEFPELKTVSKANKYPIHLLQYYECSKATLQHLTQSVYQFPGTVDPKPQVDGILFYHKECSYEAGFSPLVGWLKVYMLPEILSIGVNAAYLEDKPADYTTLEEHIDESKKQSRNWWTVKRFNPDAMTD